MAEKSGTQQIVGLTLGRDTVDSRTNYSSLDKQDMIGRIGQKTFVPKQYEQCLAVFSLKEVKQEWQNEFRTQ